MSLWPASLNPVVPSTTASFSVSTLRNLTWLFPPAQSHKADSAVVSASASRLALSHSIKGLPSYPVGEPSLTAAPCVDQQRVSWRNRRRSCRKPQTATAGAQRSDALQLRSRTTEETSNKLKRNSTHAGDLESPSTCKMGVATPLPIEAQRGSCWDPSSSEAQERYF